MKAKHRKILIELMGAANELGGRLDGTATCEAKYRDRQKAHMYTYKILLAVLSDHPDNESNDYYWDEAQEAIKEMKELKNKNYPDRRGNY